VSEEHHGLEIVAFEDIAGLRAWLEEVGTSHPGVWVRLQRAKSRKPSVTFHDLLVEGITFGWSESARHAYDNQSYLQRFTPRRTRGTASEGNKQIATELEEAGRMTDAGRAALGL